MEVKINQDIIEYTKSIFLLVVQMMCFFVSSVFSGGWHLLFIKTLL